MPEMILDAELIEMNWRDMETALLLEFPSAQSSPVPDLPSSPLVVVHPLRKPRLSSKSSVGIKLSRCLHPLLQPVDSYSISSGVCSDGTTLPWSCPTGGRAQQERRLDLQMGWGPARLSSCSEPGPVLSHAL